MEVPLCSLLHTLTSQGLQAHSFLSWNYSKVNINNSCSNLGLHFNVISLRSLLLIWVYLVFVLGSQNLFMRRRGYKDENLATNIYWASTLCQAFINMFSNYSNPMRQVLPYYYPVSNQVLDSDGSYSSKVTRLVSGK